MTAKGFTLLALGTAATVFSGCAGHAADASPVAIVRMTATDQFVPSKLTIHQGERVRWINASQTVHTATDDPTRAAYAGDATLPKGASAFSSGYVRSGRSYSHVFTVPGVYRYFCIPHETVGMVGTITVLGAGASGTQYSGHSKMVRVQRYAAEPSSLFPSRVYVTLQRTGAVEEFPEQQLWTGFPQAHYLVVGPQARVLLVGGFQNGNVYVADGRTGVVRAMLHVGGLLQGVMIDPSGHFGLAVDASQNRVAVIDLRSARILRMIRVGKTPHNAVFSPDGMLAYITIQGGRAVDVIDMRRFSVVRRIALPSVNGPHNLDRSGDGSQLWVRSYGAPNEDGEVAHVDLDSGRLLGRIHVGLYHGGIDVRPAGSPLFTTNIGGDTVDAIDPQTLRVLRHIRVGAGPHGVRESANGRYVYVASTRTSTLSIIDVRALRVVRTIRLRGVDPFWLTVEGNV